jgi:hypothetical protein
MRTGRARELCRALKDVGLRPTAFPDPPKQCRDPSPLVRTITPHVTGGNAPLRRRLTTRGAIATCDSGWLLGRMLEAALRRLEDQP